MRVQTSLVIIDSEATKSKIAVALNKEGIIYATIKYPRLPVWFKDEVELLHRNFEYVSYKTLNIINEVKKVFTGSKVIEYTPHKEEIF